MAALKVKNNEFALRSLSSVFIVVIIISAIYSGGFFWSCTASIIALISLAEFYGMISKPKELEQERERERERPRKRKSLLSPGIGYIFSFIVLLSAMKGSRPIFIALVLSLEVYAVFFLEILKRQISKGESHSIINAGGIITGVLFISVPWTSMILLRDYYIGRQILITLFSCTWGCDVLAYLGGRAFGRNKLCPYVSEGKTWEGFFAGVVGSLLINAAAIYLFRLPTYPLIYIGFICGIAGQLGDLAESIIKRECGEKDSGNLIPGHGGMLDRFDSILINGLLTYLILEVLL